MAFFKISSKYCDLDRSRPRSYNFKGLFTGYPLANFHNSAINSVQDIANVKVCHRQRQTERQTDGQTDRQMPEDHYID